MYNVASVLAFWPILVVSIPLLMWLGNVTQYWVTPAEAHGDLPRMSSWQYAKAGFLGGTMTFGVVLLVAMIP